MNQIRFCQPEEFYQILQKQQVSIQNSCQQNKKQQEITVNQQQIQNGVSPFSKSKLGKMENPLMESISNVQNQKLYYTPAKTSQFNNNNCQQSNSGGKFNKQQKQNTPSQSSQQISPQKSVGKSNGIALHNNINSNNNVMVNEDCQKKSDNCSANESYYQNLYLKVLEDSKQEKEFLQRKLGDSLKSYQEITQQFSSKMAEKEQCFKKLDEENKRLRKERNTLQLKLISLDQKFKKFQNDQEELFKQKIQEEKQNFEAQYLETHKTQLQTLQQIQQYLPQFQQFLAQQENSKNDEQSQQNEQNQQIQRVEQNQSEEEPIDESEMGSLMYAMKLQAQEDMMAQQQNHADIDSMTYEQLLELQDQIGYVSKGLTKEQIKLIKKVEFSSEILNEFGQNMCSVCFTDYSEKEKVRILNCKHMYHSGCIKNWLKQEKTCPVCKNNALSPEQQDQFKPSQQQQQEEQDSIQQQNEQQNEQQQQVQQQEEIQQQQQPTQQQQQQAYSQFQLPQNTNLNFSYINNNTQIEEEDEEEQKQLDELNQEIRPTQQQSQQYQIPQPQQQVSQQNSSTSFQQQLQQRTQQIVQPSQQQHSQQQYQIQPNQQSISHVQRSQVVNVIQNPISNNSAYTSSRRSNSYGGQQSGFSSFLYSTNMRQSQNFGNHHNNNLQ